MARFNWQIWAGFLLSIIGFISYPFVFVNWPVTRDIPWVNLLLYALSVILLLFGLNRAWRRNSTRWSRVVSLTLAMFSVLMLGFFVFSVFIYARWLPPSTGAPQKGERAHDFSLVASNGESVALSELLTTPIEGKTPRGVLLIFYRGYW
jgi:hypothetical protein